MAGSATLKDKFPIHWLVWHNDYLGLDDALKESQVCIREHPFFLDRFLKLKILLYAREAGSLVKPVAAAPTRLRGP